MADCWRYERPGYCRRRNHIQWTCDIVGIPNEDAEIELLTMLITFYKNVGLTTKDIAIHLNHVDALPTLLEAMGKPVKDHTWMHQFRKVIDKYRKINRNELCIALNQLGFTHDEVNKLLDSIANCSDINTYAKLFGNETPFVKSLQNIVHGVEHAQHSDWLHMDLSIVRGTDYYTGAVFECFDRMHPQHRAIAGGGRYDNYLGPKENNDRQLSYSVGFGMGNIGIIETMRSRNLLQEQIFTDIVLYNPHSSSRVPLRGVDLVHVKKVLYSLRDSGNKVFHYFQGNKLAKALEFAERASSIALIYPKLDDATGTLVYQVHNIPSKSKTLVDKEDVLQFLERMRRHKTN
uniref:histidine--tRNA ligase n=1 Tax=Babesia bovis TaxID=5865 RepID=S6BHX0_BABBO|nr:hypothetical protein [Babesia bovis]